MVVTVVICKIKIYTLTFGAICMRLGGGFV